MGGGVMRAVGKVAGVGIVNASLHGGVQVSLPSTEQSVMRVAASGSASSAIAVCRGGISSVAGTMALANHKVSWEMVDDGEFAGGVEEEVALVGSSTISSRGEPMARVLFGGVPSLEEAKEVTSDLKDAIDKAYLSSPKSGEMSQVSSLSLLSNPEEPKDCVACNVKATSVLKPAIQAFKLLYESSAVQSVVASIAADPNVWNAALNNSAYMDFIQSMKSNVEFGDQGPPQSSESSVKLEEYKDFSGDAFSAFLQNIKTSEVEMSVVAADPIVWIAVLNNSAYMDFIQSMQSNVEFGYQGSPRSSESSVKQEEYKDYSGDAFSDFLQNIKTSVVGMLSKATDFLRSRFSLPSAEKAKENAGSNNFDTIIGARLMGLVLMVIMVVLLKRV